MNIERDVKNIIIDVLNLELTPDEIPADVPFLQMGMQLDSLTGLRIVLSLEKQFNFTIQVGELTREVFSDVQHLAGFVRDKLGAENGSASSSD